MAAPQDFRASDADRQRVADALRRHAGEGRLTLDELGERLEEVFGARMLSDLDGPAGPMRELPPLQPPIRVTAGAQPPVWSPPAPAMRPWYRTPQFALAVAFCILALTATAPGFGALWIVWLMFFWVLRLSRMSRRGPGPWSGPRRGGWHGGPGRPLW